MILPTDTQLAAWTGDLYAGTTGFDHVVQVNPAAPFIAIKYLDGLDGLFGRGSKTWLDWIRDGLSEEARAITEYPQLGLIPFGFGMFMPETWAAVKPLLRGLPIVGAAHSLACPELNYQASAHLIEGGTVAKLALFEPPNAGMAALTALMVPIDIHAYWNGIDPVPKLPFPLTPHLPWEPQREFRRVNIAPLRRETIEDLPGLHGVGYHSLALVAQGVAAYEAANP